MTFARFLRLLDLIELGVNVAQLVEGSRVRFILLFGNLFAEENPLLFCQFWRAWTFIF